jgi:hypothetical protein
MEEEVSFDDFCLSKIQMQFISGHLTYFGFFFREFEDEYSNIRIEASEISSLCSEKKKVKEMKNFD